MQNSVYPSNFHNRKTGGGGLFDGEVVGGVEEVFDKQKSNKFPFSAIYLWSAAKNSTGSRSFDTFDTKERKKGYLLLLLGHTRRDEDRRKHCMVLKRCLFVLLGSL